MENNNLFINKIYPYLLVCIQLSCLVFLLVSAPMISKGYGGILVESAGLFLGILAIFQNGIGNFNIAPTIRPGGVLVTNGIYRLIRHPMYLAQLLLTLPLIVDYFSNFRLIIWLLLLIVLLVKVQYEESRLRMHYKAYSDYSRNTKKLIPFIY